MAVERRKQTLLLNHLYKVIEDPSVPGINYMQQPHLFINSGTVDVYGSNSESVPANFAAMTLNDENTAVKGIIGFYVIPTYIAITQNTGSTTELTVRGTNFIDMGVLL